MATMFEKLFDLILVQVTNIGFVLVLQQILDCCINFNFFFLFGNPR